MFAGEQSALSGFARLAWYGVAILHAPAVVGALRAFVVEDVTVGRFGRLAALLASILFFVLKGRDVAFLRWNHNWRSWLGVGLVVVIVHLGAIEKSISANAQAQNHPLAAFTLALGPHGLFKELRKRWRDRPSFETSWAKPTTCCGFTFNTCFVARAEVHISGVLPRPPPV
jgi:hypothetical protein